MKAFNQRFTSNTRFMIRNSSSQSWKTFGNVDPAELSGKTPHKVKNLLNGKWIDSSKEEIVLDPMNGDKFISVPSTTKSESSDFIKSLLSCPKSGLHNPIKNPERYLLLGDVTANAASKLKEPQVSEYFAKLIQRVAPKSFTQALGEVKVTQKFLENFGGDQVRFLARSFGVPGDHYGQFSHGYRSLPN